MKLTTISLSEYTISKKYNFGLISFNFENNSYDLEFDLKQIENIDVLKNQLTTIDFYKNVGGTFFTNLIINKERYNIRNDLLDEIKYHEPTPLKQLGMFDIYISHIEYLPTRKKGSELKTFPGLKINYIFEDNFASPNFFYLSLHLNDWKNESLKVYKEQKEILVLISLILDTKQKYKNLSIPKTLNAFLDDMLYDETKGMERIQELNSILSEHKIKTKIKSTIINDKHIVFFPGFFVDDVIKTKVDKDRVYVVDSEEDLDLNTLILDEGDDYNVE